MVVLPLKLLPLPPTPILKSKPGFHKAVRQLLAKTDKPCKPVNYRGKPHIRSAKYVLLHEEEQHLADHLASLAQTSPDPFCVSAIMIEESSTPPSLHIRLAANKTPTAKSVAGLKDCLKTVEKFAKTGTDRDEYETTLLNQVIELSKLRLHSRMDFQQAREGRWPRRKSKKPLHTRIQILLDSLNNQPSPLKNSIRPLARKLPNLIQALKNIDETIASNKVDQLRKVILSSHEISTFNGSPSLEHYLDSLACGVEISQHGTVLTIDKISQYLDVCTYLLNLCREPKYRPLFCNITLEPLISPPASHPDGVVARHYVHGEIQLILYHEQNPKSPSPRCIGSSKSACFLCDSFIRKHGKFHISHSHKRLYERWTVPEEPWMISSCGEKLDNILKDMSREILDLAETWKRPAKCENNGAESRVHLLTLPKSAKSSE
ncbi:hypothetical protein EAF04_001901 [Stromatinia cepivora]|nr:hypothetical protein EAF04_001901 [Stromatinia cepivora]